MEGDVRRRYLGLFRDSACGQAIRAGDHEHADDVQTGLLGQRAKCNEGLALIMNAIDNSKMRKDDISPAS